VSEITKKAPNYKLLFKLVTLALCIVIALFIVENKMSRGGADQQVGLQAIAVLTPLNGSGVKGQVIFEQREGYVHVTARVSGLNPNQKHGFHVHHFGDLSDGNGKSAGPHYNPQGFSHGLPPTEMRHAGSFGNIVADKEGNALFRLKDTTITIKGDYHPALGRAVVVHANEDTGEQPSGNAGPRIAFGVIGYKHVK